MSSPKVPLAPSPLLPFSVLRLLPISTSLSSAASHHLGASHLRLRHPCLGSVLPAEKCLLVFSEANSLKSRSLSGKFTNVVSLLVRILDSENRFRSGVGVSQGQSHHRRQRP